MFDLRRIGNWFADLPGGRRSKYAIVAVWIVILMVMGPLAGKFEDAQENDPADYLPGNAESVEAITVLEDFPSGDIANAITVFQRDGGLDVADKAAIEETREAIDADAREGVGETSPPIYSEDESAALLVTPITVEDGTNEAGELMVDATDDIKGTLEDLPEGLNAAVTGPAGFAADAIEVFDSINGTLLYATALLVLVLLIIIYRSPIFWLIPLFSVILAEITSRGVGYLLAEAGVTVTGQSGGILPVLVFGAGTDYALLLVSRYREELRTHEDKHEAVRIAMRKAGPAIVASGLTVMAALLTLSLAEVTGTSGLGPIGALGVGIAMVSMLTILPALLAITGRRAFWPFIPQYGSEGIDETHGALEQDRGMGRKRSSPRMDRDHCVAAGAVPRPDAAEQRPDLGQRVPRRRRLGRGAGAGRAEHSRQAPTHRPTSSCSTPPSSRRSGGGRGRAGCRRRSAPVEEEGPAGVKLEADLEEDPLSTAGFDLVPGIRDAAHGAARTRSSAVRRPRSTTCASRRPATTA